MENLAFKFYMADISDDIKLFFIVICVFVAFVFMVNAKMPDKMCKASAKVLSVVFVLSFLVATLIPSKAMIYTYLAVSTSYADDDDTMAHKAYKEYMRMLRKETGVKRFSFRF